MFWMAKERAGPELDLRSVSLHHLSFLHVAPLPEARARRIDRTHLMARKPQGWRGVTDTEASMLPLVVGAPCAFKDLMIH